MRNMANAVSLLAALLLVGGGSALAKELPDLVPWNGRGGIGIPKFSCERSPGGTWRLYAMIGVKNIGSATTTVQFKVLLKVNGAVWDNPVNPHFANTIMSPGEVYNFNTAADVPGPGGYTLWVKVDAEDAQAELNENNNVAIAQMGCGEPAVPRVQPPKLYPKPKIGPPPVKQPSLPPAITK